MLLWAQPRSKTELGVAAFTAWEAHLCAAMTRAPESARLKEGHVTSVPPRVLTRDITKCGDLWRYQTRSKAIAFFASDAVLVLAAADVTKEKMRNCGHEFELAVHGPV